jgi:hypothetical protein
VKGISKYPNGTHGTITILFDEAVLPGANGFFRVQDGRFEVKFEASKLWAGKRFFPGPYEVEVQVNPKVQHRAVMAKIKKDLGPLAAVKAYRNKYVQVGTREEMKKKEDKLREHYCSAIRGAQNLYGELKEKFKLAKVKFTSQFHKLDRDGKKQIDPNNKNTYLVDEAKFLQYLRDNPNEFYDSTGRFQEDVWRRWLDDKWRFELNKLLEKHAALKKGYVAIAWPGQFDDMTTALKMLLQLSAQHSVNLYKWSNLLPDKKDEKLLKDAGGANINDILRLIKIIRLKLRLSEYINSKKEKEAVPQKTTFPKKKATKELQQKNELAGEKMYAYEEEKRIAKRQRPLPAPKKKPEEDHSYFTYYFLAILAILLAAVILKRKL